eukprot:1159170-Pelagomonas_calceolata.AAC.3
MYTSLRQAAISTRKGLLHVGTFASTEASEVPEGVLKTITRSAQEWRCKKGLLFERLPKGEGDQAAKARFSCSWKLENDKLTK